MSPARTEEDIYKAFKPYYESTPIGENADPQRLSELQHKLQGWAIFAPADVNAFAEVWYRAKRDHSATDHKQMNAILDAVVERFKGRDVTEQDEFRGQLTAYRNLYAFLSQVSPIRTATSSDSMPSSATSSPNFHRPGTATRSHWTTRWHSGSSDCSR